MGLFTRRILLWATAAIGTFVGLWAAAWPDSFYDAFPGFGRVWVAIDGPFNEHLIRDVGALYLALAAASAYAALVRASEAARAVGIAWVVFSLPHLAYHLGHLHDLSPLDVVLQIITLSSTILLGAPLVWPDRWWPGARSRAAERATTARTAVATTEADAR